MHEAIAARPGRHRATTTRTDAGGNLRLVLAGVAVAAALFATTGGGEASRTETRPPAASSAGTQLDLAYVLNHHGPNHWPRHRPAMVVD